MTGLMARIPEVADDVALAELILNETGVALVPGSAFGAQGYLRLSFATSMDNLRQAMTRLQKFGKSR
jgi:aspartate aminotransferase